MCLFPICFFFFLCTLHLSLCLVSLPEAPETQQKCFFSHVKGNAFILFPQKNTGSLCPPCILMCDFFKHFEPWLTVKHSPWVTCGPDVEFSRDLFFSFNNNVQKKEKKIWEETALKSFEMRESTSSADVVIKVSNAVYLWCCRHDSFCHCHALRWSHLCRAECWRG